MTDKRTFVPEKETKGEKFNRAPRDPPDDRRQRGLPLGHRANGHWDAEAHDPHKPVGNATLVKKSREIS